MPKSRRWRCCVIRSCVAKATTRSSTMKPVIIMGFTHRGDFANVCDSAWRGVGCGRHSTFRCRELAATVIELKAADGDADWGIAQAPFMRDKAARLPSRTSSPSTAIRWCMRSRLCSIFTAVLTIIPTSTGLKRKSWSVPRPDLFPSSSRFLAGQIKIRLVFCPSFWSHRQFTRIFVSFCWYTVPF